MKLTPELVAGYIRDIERDRRIATCETCSKEQRNIAGERAEHNRRELFTAIRDGLREQYLVRRLHWTNPITGILTKQGKNAGFEFILGYCAALVALGFLDDFIPTMTAFLASTRDADDALGLDKFGQPKVETPA
jgi:hypothetical protein